MIKSENEYLISKEQLEGFKQALDGLNCSKEFQQLHPLLQKAQKDAIQSQINDLISEIEEYEALLRKAAPEFGDWENLPRNFIRARISLGLSQRELAAAVGLTEDEIRRYENNDYQSAGLDIVLRISKVLNVMIDESLITLCIETPLNVVIRNLLESGIDKNFINRIFPAFTMKKFIEGKFGIVRLLTSLSRIFGTSPEEILQRPLILNMRMASAVRFKMPKGINETRTSAYVLYAEHVASILLRATPALKKEEIPVDPIKFRSNVISRYGSFSFQNSLCYVWDLGVAVLPLNDPGAFHGAFWRKSGRNVIVLKQRHRSEDRWLFDLLHELYHAAQEPELEERTVIDFDENDQKQIAEKEELLANKFAGGAILDGRAEELVSVVMQISKGQIPFLKNAVAKVAEREGVRVGALANYLAFRLSLQGENWWGTANNLQEEGNDPWRITRDTLFDRIDLSNVDEFDKKLFAQAIAESEV